MESNSNFVSQSQIYVAPKGPIGGVGYLASIIEARFSASILWKTCGSCTNTWLMEPVSGTFLTATCQQLTKPLGDKAYPVDQIISCHMTQ